MAAVQVPVLREALSPVWSHSLFLDYGDDMQWIPGALGEVTVRGTRCNLCPHRCTLRPGQAGVCKVRRGTAGGLETATFATSVLHTDAIERKPFFHFRPGSTAVTLAAPGCSFHCDYCVNYRISQYGKDEESEWDAAPVDAGAVVDQAAVLGACVALSYSEPSLAPELTLELARLGRVRGVDVVWKSNGFLTPEAVALCAPALTAVNIDVKGVKDESHRRLTGGSVRPVLAAIRAFRELGTWVEVTTPLIPGVTDPGAVAAAIAEISPDIPWHLARFTPAYRMQGQQPTSPADLSAAVQAGRAAGLRYVYVERALGAPGRSTRCPRCQAVVVDRGVWSFGGSRLRDGCCPDCGSVVEGRW